MALDPHEIHYGIRGQRFGPVDLHTLVDRIRAGQISADDFLWDEDAQDWVPLRRYGVLLASLGEDLPEEIDPDDPRLSPLPETGPGASAPPDTLVPAGLALRALAWLIDGLTLLVPISIWILFAENYTGFDVEAWSQITHPTAVQTREFLRYLLITQTGVFLIHGIYHALLESSTWQATIGKRAMGIRVTDEAGRRITFGRAVGRHCARLLCELTLFLGYLMILMTARGQGLHDRIAGTLVVRNR
jgi:uncharacterized RDD family membrane protein YckC